MSGLQITSHGIVVDGLQLQTEVFDGSDASKHPEILRRLSEELNRAGIPLPKDGVTAASYLKRNQYLYATTPAEQQPVANPMTPAQQQQGFKDGDLDLTLPNRRLLLKDQGQDDVMMAKACALFMKLIEGKVSALELNQAIKKCDLNDVHESNTRGDQTETEFHKKQAKTAEIHFFALRFFNTELQSNLTTEVHCFVLQFIYDNREYNPNGDHTNRTAGFIPKTFNINMLEIGEESFFVAPALNELGISAAIQGEASGSEKSIYADSCATHPVLNKSYKHLFHSLKDCQPTAISGVGGRVTQKVTGYGDIVFMGKSIRAYYAPEISKSVISEGYLCRYSNFRITREGTMCTIMNKTDNSTLTIEADGTLYRIPESAFTTEQQQRTRTTNRDFASIS